MNSKVFCLLLVIAFAASQDDECMPNLRLITTAPSMQPEEQLASIKECLIFNPDLPQLEDPNSMSELQNLMMGLNPNQQMQIQCCMKINAGVFDANGYVDTEEVLSKLDQFTTDENSYVMSIYRDNIDTCFEKVQKCEIIDFQYCLNEACAQAL